MALLSAVAAVGYRDLMQALAAVHPTPSTPDQLADLAAAYVRFALARPGLFRIMFAEGCDREHPERVSAVTAVNDYLQDALVRAVGGTVESNAPLATGLWSAAHGLAFLYLDGKLEAAPPAEVAHRVRSIVAALLGTATRQ